MSPKLKIALTTLMFLLLFGTIFYHAAEKWSYVDSFYFTAITLTTIGYGDIYPTTDLTKIVTALFAISGVAVALYALTILGSDYFEKREQEFAGRLLKDTSEKNALLTGEVLRADKHVMDILKKIDQHIKK